MTIEQESSGREDSSSVTMGMSARVMMIHNVFQYDHHQHSSFVFCFYKAGSQSDFPLPPVCSLKPILVDRSGVENQDC
jgi:hypothetical protein